VPRQFADCRHGPATSTRPRFPSRAPLQVPLGLNNYRSCLNNYRPVTDVDATNTQRCIMNKNWGDKADKDLFFTLLSVKNVGVITGSEWATVGNTMRMMGYGFTNEGCR